MHVEVRESTLENAGYGLFTTRKIKLNDKILFKYEGEEMSIEDVNGKYGKTDNFAPYVFKVSSSNKYTDTACDRHFTSYINHSKTPNLDKLDFQDDTGKWFVAFKANRSIEKDEELFIDYISFPQQITNIIYDTCVIPLIPENLKKAMYE